MSLPPRKKYCHCFVVFPSSLFSMLIFVFSVGRLYPETNWLPVWCVDMSWLSPRAFPQRACWEQQQINLSLWFVAALIPRTPLWRSFNFGFSWVILVGFWWDEVLISLELGRLCLSLSPPLTWELCEWRAQIWFIAQCEAELASRNKSRIESTCFFGIAQRTADSECLTLIYSHQHGVWHRAGAQ